MTQLETLQALFKNRAFVIPDYQRGYAWEKDQRQDLLNDLEDLHQVGQDKVHYTGTVVLHRGAHESKSISGAIYDIVDIVDGQQRITTLIVLLHCVITALAAVEDEESQETATFLYGGFCPSHPKGIAGRFPTPDGHGNHLFSVMLKMTWSDPAFSWIW